MNFKKIVAATLVGVTMTGSILTAGAQEVNDDAVDKKAAVKIQLRESYRENMIKAYAEVSGLSVDEVTAMCEDDLKSIFTDAKEKDLLDDLKVKLNEMHNNGEIQFKGMGRGHGKSNGHGKGRGQRAGERLSKEELEVAREARKEAMINAYVAVSGLSVDEVTAICEDDVKSLYTDAKERDLLDELKDKIREMHDNGEITFLGKRGNHKGSRLSQEERAAQREAHKEAMVTMYSEISGLSIDEVNAICEEGLGGIYEDAKERGLLDTLKEKMMETGEVGGRNFRGHHRIQGNRNENPKGFKFDTRLKKDL